MSEREPDHTPKPADAPTRNQSRRPGDYYYDDSHGYEIYRPDEDDDEDGESGEDEEDGDGGRLSP